MPDDFTIRTMTPEDMATAVDWAAREGWNPGIHDADIFHNADKNGFFIALDETGQALGVISAVRYGQDYGFIGFFIVRPDLRGQRIGVALGKTALAYLQGRNIGIDGVLNKVRNYQAFGFKLAYKNIRFKGVTSGQRPEAGAFGLDDITRNDILDYDSHFFPAPRKRFTEEWIIQPDSHFAATKKDGRLTGYGVARKCRSGYKIGPLFAEDKSSAAIILDTLTAKLTAGTDYYLDIPEPNRDAIALVEEHGMEQVFATARMYSMATPDLPLNKTFGITSFELG